MIEICEVGPRDGLQNEAICLSVDQRVELITGLVEAGMDTIEAVSFVHPKVVPQMANPEEVLKRVPRKPGVRYAGLVLNKKGMERAFECELDDLHIAIAASSTFNMKNSRRTREDTLKEMLPLVHEGKKRGYKMNGIIATAFGCPYEGDVPFSVVIDMAERYIEEGADLITLADTTGMAHPGQVTRYVDLYHEKFPRIPLALHFHNTRGLALANIYAGYLAGVRRFDSSIAGIGGCPFAPYSVGNVSTEDMVNLFEQMGETTPVDLPRLLELTKLVENAVGHDSNCFVSKVGLI
ncbi:MAG TPA: hydroxymethylglutaryl-CoA lyase [Candidatus Angelobacter sp.]|nr:hydroxymethylglutaryl-CoA lyase [Candidatus Angelobacter sp.]